LDLTPRKPSNLNPFHKGQVVWWDNLPPVATAKVTSFRHDKNPVSTPPVIVLRHRLSFPAQCVSYTHEWTNLTRDDVLRLRKTPPLVSFMVGLVGWLVFHIIMVQGVAWWQRSKHNFKYDLRFSRRWVRRWLSSGL
jgi:hypothetical protein